MQEPSEDLKAIEQALRALTEPGQIFEIRCIHDRKYRGLQGFFDDPGIAAELLGQLDSDYKGVYVTLNPLEPDIIHRAPNKLKQLADGLGAYDNNVTRRRWLPLDFDPVRVKGISSTPTEQAQALKLAKSVADTLELVYGFPSDPLFASSGNGAHLVYPVDLPNDDETRDLFKSFMGSLKSAFETKQVEFDTSNFNASRIWRLYGTVARKGDHTLERPHRVAKALNLGGRSELLSADAIRDFAERNGSGITSRTASAIGKSLYEKSYPKDEGKYRILNRAALDRIDEWVPSLFGDDARPYQHGYRISSLALNRDLEEDLTIHPWPRGIKDFGEHDSGETAEGRRTPITVIAEQLFADDKDDAVEWLSGKLKLDDSEFAKVAARAEAEEADADYEEVFKGSKAVAKKFDYTGIRSLDNLYAQKFRELHFLVEDYIPEGAFFLVSRPKMRKSWLMLQLGIAVATGGEFLGKKVKQGEVLGLFLEENDRRMKRRLETLFTFNKVPDLSKFHFWTPGSLEFDESFPRGTDGVAVIRKWLETHPDCKLIIIDTFAHYRSHETGRNQNIYQMDYEEVMPLTRLAAEYGLTLIVVHHERKGSLKESMDFIEDTSGSTGLTGGVDGIMAIKGKRGITDENEVRQLAITGRDVINDYLLNISFDAELGGWRLAKQQDVAETIIALLRKYPVLKTTELYGLAPNIPQARIRQVLLDMRHEGRIENTAHGYRLPGV